MSSKDDASSAEAERAGAREIPTHFEAKRDRQVLLDRRAGFALLTRFKMLLVNFLYLLALVIWIGSLVFFSFIAAPSLFKALPPEFAGRAVGAIFPKYFPLGYLCGFVALFAAIFSAARTGVWPLFKIAILLVMLTLAIWNGLMTHPRARAIKEEIQTETGKTDVTLLQREFTHTHRISVAQNILVLLLGLILLLATASRLQI